MAANGKDMGATVIIDPSKLDGEGREMLGETKALIRWVAMFCSMRDASRDVQERVFLAEVIKAIEDDAEYTKVALTNRAFLMNALDHPQISKADN